MHVQSDEGEARGLLLAMPGDAVRAAVLERLEGLDSARAAVCRAALQSEPMAGEAAVQGAAEPAAGMPQQEQQDAAQIQQQQQRGGPSNGRRAAAGPRRAAGSKRTSSAAELPADSWDDASEGEAKDSEATARYCYSV